MTQFRNVRPAILDRIERMGYPVFENGDYDVNIIGVRSAKRQAGAFDDVIHLAYKTDGQWMHFEFCATTDPGIYWLQNGRSEGTAILVPGHYRGCWQLGLHRGKYKALTQCKPVQVYRDNNRDDIIDMIDENIDEGIFGINIHRAHSTAEVQSVGKYSAGCQVIQRSFDFGVLIRACEEQVASRGWHTFSYTLIEE